MGTRITTYMFTNNGLKKVRQESITMNSIKDQYQEFTTKLSKLKSFNNILDIKQLPDDIRISTMTIVGKIGTTFNVATIAKYLDLSHNFLETIKYGSTYRTLSQNMYIKGHKKNKGSQKSFYNQVSLLVKIENFIKINIKLFTNGSIQMTGCKNIKSALWVLDQIFDKLKTVKYVFNKSMTQIIPSPFTNDSNALDIEKIFNFKIAMINSGFNIGFKINREKLYNCLIANKYDCTYDPTSHACVNIKHHMNDKIVSIFVFDSGAIIITGANSIDHILSSYKFINIYLITNYKKIVRRDINTNTLKNIKL